MTLSNLLGRCRKKAKDAHTHTWFADGPSHNRTTTLHLTQVNVAEMRKLIVNETSISMGRANPLSISEKISKDASFKLVVDLDFTAKDIENWQVRNKFCDLSKSDLLQNWAKTMRDIIGLYIDILTTVTGLTGSEIEMLLATRLPYKIHLHFPSIIVKAAAAKRIAQLFVVAFKQAFPELFREGVIDESIYSTGVRILYCHKGSMSNHDKIHAEIVAHENIFGAGSHRDSYWITDPYTWKQSNNPSIQDLIKTSIHIDKDDSETPLNFPSAVSDVSTRRKASPSIKQTSRQRVQQDTSQQSPHAKLAETLAATFQISASDFKWSGVLVCSDTEQPKLTLPTSCKTCPFAQREHSSNHLYLLLSSSKVILKCHDDQCTECIIIDTTTFPQNARTQLDSLLKSYVEHVEEITEDMRLQAVGQSLDSVCREHPKMNISHPSIFRTRLGGGDHWMCKLPDNMWCPIHQREHDSASNCIIMTLREQQIICQLEPELLLELPLLSQYGSVIFGNQIINNNLNITVNGKVEPELAIDGIFDEVYPIFADTVLNRLMLESFNGFSYNIARVVHHLGREHMGLGESNEKDVWWVWNQTSLRWEKNSRLAGSFVSVRVAAKYIEAQHWFRTHTSDTKLRALRDSKIDAIVKRLKDKDKRIILRDVAEVFNEVGETSMDSKLDKDPYLLGFQREIYDLRTGTRRPAASTDYVSMCVGYEMPEAVDHLIRGRIIETLRQIQPDEEECEYLLLFLASTLDGRNAEEIFTIWTGNGRNGKGFLQELMLKTVGDYFQALAVTMLTNERPDSSKPIPDVLNLRNKRFAAASEPEERKQINAGFVKWLTGNDPISGCFKHENEEVKFRGQHSLVMLCNKIPAINAEDKAFWRRARVQHFGMAFVDNPRPGTNERQVDRNLKLQIESWAPQFMLLLLEYYQKYQDHGLQPTDAILQFTHSARNDNNPLLEFITEHYEKTDEESDRIKRKQVHDDLETWCKQGGFERKELCRKKQQIQHQLKELMISYGYELDEFVDASGKLKAKMKRVTGEDGTHAAFSYIRAIKE